MLNAWANCVKACFTKTLGALICWAVMAAGLNTLTAAEVLIADDAIPGTAFGADVSIHGDILVVGAPGDYTDAGVLAGSAYVFVRDGTKWVQRHKLTASDGAALDEFGFSVAVFGNTIAIGSVANDAVPGQPGAGAVYVFQCDENKCVQEAKLIADNPQGQAYNQLGFSIAMSGDTIVAGAPYVNTFNLIEHGAAYVYVRSNGNWTMQAKLIAGDLPAPNPAPPTPIFLSFARFGSSVAIDSNTIVVGAHRNDTAAGEDAGSAFVYLRNGTNWTQWAQLAAKDAVTADRFGASVAIDGDTILVGANHFLKLAPTNTGAAYVFTRFGPVWRQQAKLIPCDLAPGDFFGGSVAVKGDTAYVGASNKDSAAGVDSGAVYRFLRNGTNWIRQSKRTADYAFASGWFGRSMALDGNNLLVGAPRDFEAARGFGLAYVLDASPQPGMHSTLSPSTGYTVVSNAHTVLATLTSNDLAAGNIAMSFQVIDGPNAGRTGTNFTDECGEALFTYQGNGVPGVDTIRATGIVSGVAFTVTATNIWLAPPVARARNMIVAANTNCQAQVSAAQVDNGSSDPDGTILSRTLHPPGPYPLGNTPVTLTVIDDFGLTNAGSALITVVDQTQPQITCPAGVVTNVASGATSVAVHYNPATAIDNCNGVTISYSPPSGSTFPLGTNIVVCTAIDNAGNFTNGTFQVIVEDWRDLAVVKLTVPRTVRLAAKQRPARTKRVVAQIQNLGAHAIHIPDFATMAQLVTLQITALKTNCSPPEARLIEGRPNLVPRTLNPQEKLNVFFEITFTMDCVPDASKGSSHEDFSYSVTVHRDALDGNADLRADNDRLDGTVFTDVSVRGGYPIYTTPH